MTRKLRNMFRLHVPWMFVIFRSLFITQVSGTPECPKQDYTKRDDLPGIIPLKCRGTSNEGNCCWSVKPPFIKENEFIRVTVDDGDHCDSSIKIYVDCKNEIIFGEFYCEEENEGKRTADINTNCEYVKVSVTNCERNCFNVELTIVKEDDDDMDRNKWIVIGLPVAMVSMTIILIILLVLLLCKKPRKSQDSHTMDKISQNEAAISNPYQRKQDIELDMKNSDTTQRESLENLDHLEGDGVEINPVYASGADYEQNVERAYETVESNDEMKQHEYSSIDPKSLSGKEN